MEWLQACAIIVLVSVVRRLCSDEHYTALCRSALLGNVGKDRQKTGILCSTKALLMVRLCCSEPHLAAMLGR